MQAATFVPRRDVWQKVCRLKGEFFKQFHAVALGKTQMAAVYQLCPGLPTLAELGMQRCAELLTDYSV